MPAIEPPATATQRGLSSLGASSATARLSYLDEAGPHVYTMRKELISIGRGGRAHWVDVPVAGSPRVSREHCRIRRAADGRYYLQDVSTWGTSVDGTPVPPFARQVDGRVDETGHEQALASGARIQLADAVTLEFSVEA
jgi:pSer/pThr/pTyr-binding forkhead associated (FHA) protein